MTPQNDTKPVSVQQNTDFNISHLYQTCSHLQQTKPRDQRVTRFHQVYTVNKYRFAICVTPKAGCSFLKQLVYFLNNPQELTKTGNSLYPDRPPAVDFALTARKQREVFDLPRIEVHFDLNLYPVMVSIETFKEKLSSLKVISTRNPFTRLFSAYIDKMYIPVMWKKFAIYRKLLTYPDQQVSFCRNLRHETFEGFLLNIIQTANLSDWDPHWIPVNALCEPCSARPYMVIRQEHYNADVAKLLEVAQISADDKKFIENVIAKQGIQTRKTLQGLISSMYHKGNERGKGCFSRQEIAQRVWKALIVQGQIHCDLEFPAEKLRNIDDLSDKAVADIFLEKMDERPITAEESKRQRSKALSQAYKQVNSYILSKITEIFYYDFAMFGYDLNPPS